MSKAELTDICRYRSESVPVDPQAYVSTESMLPNRAGATTASSIPSTGKARAFYKGDTLVSNIRPYFKKIWQATDNGCCSADVLVFEPSNCDSDYLYWLLSDNSFFDYMVATSKGTKMPRGDKAAIMHYEFERMDDKDQTAIANALNPIRELININQQTNDYLSELAQALFIGWFEEHAGEREIASLTGGGEYCTLDKLCSRITDGAHKSPKADPDGVYPMLSVKDMRRYGFNYSSCKRISKADYDDMLANDCVPRVDDILVAKDGSYLKEIFITDEQREESILSSIAIFRPDTRRIAPEVLLQYLKHPRVLKLVSDNFVSGSALPRIVLKDFKKLMLLVPERSVQEAILPALRSIRELIRVNEEESVRLSSLRDLLLPKIMSGEIDASDVEPPTPLNNHLFAG